VTTIAATALEIPLAFAACHLPGIERGLERAFADLDPALGSLGSATRCAVGTEGVPGHRWRPLLTLAAAEAAGVEAATVLDVALAVELTHTASLVLDDLPCMDDCEVRRGMPATHRVVGTSGAILVALGLLGRAAELLAGAGRNGPALCRSWGRVVGLRGMSGGQAMDLAFRSAGPLKGGARRLYREKTTALAAFALSAGARAGGAAPRLGSALERFGRDLGWAYQLADDAADRQQDQRGDRLVAPHTVLRHASRLLRRAERRLADTPGMDVRGVDLLCGFGRAIVMVES